MSYYNQNQPPVGVPPPQGKSFSNFDSDLPPSEILPLDILHRNHVIFFFLFYLLIDFVFSESGCLGYPPEGYPKDAYPPQGYPPQGYPQGGYPPQGYPPQYAPQYGQPPPQQQQQSSGPGMMEGWWVFTSGSWIFFCRFINLIDRSPFAYSRSVDLRISVLVFAGQRVKPPLLFCCWTSMNFAFPELFANPS